MLHLSPFPLFQNFSAKDNHHAQRFPEPTMQVRQDILRRLFQSAIDEDNACHFNMARLCAIDCLSGIAGFRPDEMPDVSAPHILAWANTLSSTHEVIEDDIPYVLDKCLDELEDLVRNAEIPKNDIHIEKC